MNAYLLLSVGTNTSSFEDITLSVHIGEEAVLYACIGPDDARRLVSELSERFGTDTPSMLKINLVSIKKAQPGQITSRVEIT